MMAIGKLLCVPFCLLGMAGGVNATPNRENEKDYLSRPPLPWSQKFIQFKGVRGIWLTEIRWFADEAGLEFVALRPLPDSILCGINPTFQAEPKLYSLMEVFDNINEMLLGMTKHALIRDGKKLILISADEILPIRRVQIGDLPELGKTEIVWVEATFESELVAGQVKRLLGEFGHVAHIRDNRYVVRGTVQSLRLVFELCSNNPHAAILR